MKQRMVGSSYYNCWSNYWYSSLGITLVPKSKYKVGGKSKFPKGTGKGKSYTYGKKKKKRK